MSRGRHIKVRRRLYWHHGIDLGDGTVIHASGEPGRRKFGAKVRRTTMDEFLRGAVAVEVERPDALSADEIVARAEGSLGNGAYSLVWNNCEHFAHWCQTGRPASAQVTRAAWGAALLMAAVRLGLGLAARRGSAL
jgi:hypothetical protein